MQIRILKKHDGSGALTCTRTDGSVTWQPQGRHAPFFALHDLTHYAVETVLGTTRGFYGLIASGWDVADFQPPWPRGALAPDALVAELIVGYLDLERASDARWTAEEMTNRAHAYFTEHALPWDVWPGISDDQLTAIRDRRDALFAEWHAVSPGEALVVTFGV
ncbi:MAG: hypothetical protein MUE41_11645 [Gemmatimonadaceae bacterium]|jgi:hypothetical protein|nr:hypothetical protein [Gemmatimonadaceae bacterium]